MNNDEKERLFEKYQYLVYKIGKKLKNDFIDFEDMIQAGFMGLLKAINNHNNLDTFISYASKYIVYEMKEEIKKGSYFKISDYFYKLGNKVREQSELNLFEIAEKCNTSVENVLLIKSQGFYQIDKIENYDEFEDTYYKLPIGLDEIEEEVFKLKALYRYTQNDIAKALNISQSKVNRILKNIVEKIT